MDILEIPERWKGQDIKLFLKIPMQTKTGDLSFPSIDGKLVEATETTIIIMTQNGEEVCQPKAGLQHVSRITSIQTASKIPEGLTIAKR